MIHTLSCFPYLEKLCNVLCQAANRGEVETMERLLSLGVSPDGPSNLFCQRPIHIIVEKNNAETMQLLLNNNADIEGSNKHNQTPFQITALRNNAETMQILLNNSGNIETTDEFNLNQTPLHMTARWNKIVIMQLLLDHNANIEARNRRN